uniref:Type I phosphodiesterase/nucleotide pyrophosphatase n=1 Tax=Acetithermum autotrophicum TaxID=1446466 RepID=H5SVF3_ACEAU|nr:type I phosphodiesterase/nucleotide pyrophosphatase [Candidatus Acetothermum autotrophicum]
MSTHKKVVVIALDGATLDLIEPWAAAGHLPNFKELLTHGAWARLESTQPPITGAAWTSFQTGVQPGRHGIFDWLARKDGSYQLAPISSQSIKREVLWEYLSRHGKRVGVMGVPVSYPARPINGFLLTDLLTPDEVNYAYPPELKDEIEQAIGPYPVMPEHWRGRYAAQEWLKNLKRSLQRRAEIALYLLQNKPWDFFMVHVMETDSVQHQMWHLLDNIKRPRYHGGDCRGNPILEIYQLADRAIGQIRQVLDDDTTLFVISDHGFGPLYYNIYLNCWLYEHGYLALKKNVTTLFKKLAWRAGLTPENLYVWAERLRLLDLGARLRHGHLHDLLGRVFLSTQNIDWPRTRAYSYGNVGQIYLNLKGREPQGCVAPSEAPGLIAELIAGLKKFTNPYTGSPIFERIHRKEEIYWGEELARAPEIVLVPTDGIMAVGTTEFLSNKTIAPTYAGSGWHRMDGVFIAHGRAVHPGPKPKLQIVDLFPTLVTALSLPAPADIDGRVPEDLFTFVSTSSPAIAGKGAGFARTVRRAAAGGTMNSPDEVWEKEIRERLKGLGYV